MTNYTKFWDLYRKILKYSHIRKDESAFIKSLLDDFKKNNIEVPKFLVDIGCGDGRVSGFIAKKKKFKEVFLVDESSSVNLAKDRFNLLNVKLNVFQVNLKDYLKNIKEDSLVLAVGAINFFPNQHKILKQLISKKPKIIILAVTGYGFLGSIYMGLNILRKSSFISHQIGIFLNLLNRNIKYSGKPNSLKRYFYTLLVKLIEPFVASKIYRLSLKDYKFFFEKNNYKIYKNKELGLCRWIVLIRKTI